MKKIAIATIATIALSTAAFAGAATAACVGCHGVNGEKNTMAPEAVPNKLSKEEMITALKGYKEGTLNKFGKGAIMKGFAGALDDAKMEAIANEWAAK